MRDRQYLWQSVFDNYNTKPSLQDALLQESVDRQFLAIKKFVDNSKLPTWQIAFVVVVNALVCYQLSNRGEDYWEEFTMAILSYQGVFNNFDDIYEFFNNFLPESKGNKRLLKIKLKRINKLRELYEIFSKQSNVKDYYYNMYALAQELAKTMSQKLSDKTIVFAIKMYGYVGRELFGEIVAYPKELKIPLDSRLLNMYEEYCNDKLNITPQSYYVIIAKELDIPPLHLDALLWFKD